MMHDACHTDDGFTSADNGDLSWLAAERSRAAGHAGKSGSLLEHEHEHEHELLGFASLSAYELPCGDGDSSVSGFLAICFILFV